jgi:hypothetical protein
MNLEGANKKGLSSIGGKKQNKVILKPMSVFEGLDQSNDCPPKYAI